MKLGLSSYSLVRALRNREMTIGTRFNGLRTKAESISRLCRSASWKMAISNGSMRFVRRPKRLEKSAAIKCSGYDGYVSLEFEGMENCRNGSSIGLANARRSLNMQ